MSKVIISYFIFDPFLKKVAEELLDATDKELRLDHNVTRKQVIREYMKKFAEKHDGILTFNDEPRAK